LSTGNRSTIRASISWTRTSISLFSRTSRSMRSSWPSRGDRVAGDTFDVFDGAAEDVGQRRKVRAGRDSGSRFQEDTARRLTPTS
jgi:hypothetical protein